MSETRKRTHSIRWLSLSSGFNGRTWHWTCRICGTQWLWLRFLFGGEWRVADFHCPQCCGERIWCRKRRWVKSILADAMLRIEDL
jgi:hypothetical protein